MRLFQNPLIGLLIMASIVIMALTALFLWVQARPEIPQEAFAQTEVIADAPAQEGEVGPVPSVAPAVGDPASGTAFVENEVIILAPNPNELVRRADVLPQQAAPTPDPAAGQPPTNGGTDQIIVVPDPTGQQPAPTATPQTAADQPVIVFQDGGLTPTPLPTLVPADLSGVEPLIYELYVVQAGDTLYRLAQNFNTAVELMAEKGIASDDLIPGAQIRIPRPNPNYCPGLQKYVVREGDNVFRIGQRYGRTTEQLRSANNLNINYDIKIGQVLCIP